MANEAPESAGHVALKPTSTSSSSSNSPRQLAPTDQTTNTTSIPSSRSPTSRAWLSSVRRPRTSPGPKGNSLRRTLLANDDDRRDSALTPSNALAGSEPPSPTSLRKTPSLPAIVVHDETSQTRTSNVSNAAEEHSNFTGLDTFIPTGGFDDLTSDAQISFSKRGSMFLGGKKANRRSRQLDLAAESAPVSTTVTATTTEPSTPPRHNAQTHSSPQQELSPPTGTYLSPRSPSRFSARNRAASHRVLSADEMSLSRKVRAMYKHGNEGAANWDVPEEDTSSMQNSFADSSVNNTPANQSSLTVDGNQEDSSSLLSSRHGSISKEPTEAAGGVEDWANLEGGEVDRYGFIVPKSSTQQDAGSTEGLEGPNEPGIQRVTTTLQLFSEEPRKRGMPRSISRARSSRSANPRNASPARAKSSKPARSIFSTQTSESRNSHKPIRNMTNRLPHNRDRRLKDEASDMLKLPPGLAELEEQKEGGRAALAMKAKEIEREDKWRKMAKVVQRGTDQGGGMLFEFDTKDPKLVSRTWKGIPDRWRATAWYSFLAASAQADKDSPTEEELIESFYELQAENSAEDVQIDVDVPRTINRHIMFRRRYRGGQRLLFRVLHAMSLYLPETGYVQGMAALAATLLCYYEEDRAFVMLVRLWMLRGLERLYEAGFAGLMEALDDFEQNWLREGDVAKQLTELGITSTAYGTRWYLTLFNYSLPFPAQLRVWDVFMLLGDKSYSNSADSNFSGDLDVLHATSAALIDATREILLDSDFENAMKVLTSWIPIKDEDLLLRVAKAEYRMRKKRASA